MIAAREMHDAAQAGIAELDKLHAELNASDAVRSATNSKGQYDASIAKRAEFVEVHRTHKNKALDMSDAWLRDIYFDPHPDQTIRKSVQSGISEYAVVRDFAEASVGRSVIHVLPGYALRNRFVAVRVDRPVQFTPTYKELMGLAIGQGDNKAYKLFGDGMIYFLGSNVADAFTEAAGDTAVIDEQDRCNQENLALLPDRLSAEGTYAAWLRIGNPTHDDFGISAEYNDTDQGVWQVRCGSCRKWQQIDFFSHVVEVDRDDQGAIINHRLRDGKWHDDLSRDLYATCAKCGKPIDHLGQGRWAYLNAKHERRGRHISKLMTRQATLARLYGNFLKGIDDPTLMTIFINNDLGLPYSPPGSTLTEALLNACRQKGVGINYRSEAPCTMGVDVGARLDIRISDSPEQGIRRTRYIGRAPVTVDEIVGRLKRHNVRSCVIDANPETFFCKQVLKKLGRRGVERHGVWLCQFLKGQSAKDPRKDKKDRIVNVDRTQLFDAATERIRSQRNWLPRHAEALVDGEYYKQMCVPKRVLQTDPKGNERYVWTKGVDHQRLADVYDELAFQICGSALVPGSGSLGARVGGNALFGETGGGYRWH